jgi:hypothetical protein
MKSFGSLARQHFIKVFWGRGRETTPQLDRVPTFITVAVKLLSSWTWGVIITVCFRTSWNRLHYPKKRSHHCVQLLLPHQFKSTGSHLLTTLISSPASVALLQVKNVFPGATPTCYLSGSQVFIPVLYCTKIPSSPELLTAVKVKLSLCFNWAPSHEGVLGEWRYGTHSLTSTLDGGKWSASRPGRFTPRERAPGTHRIGGWVGPRAVLEAVV